MLLAVIEEGLTTKLHEEDCSIRHVIRAQCASKASSLLPRDVAFTALISGMALGCRECIVNRGFDDN